MRRDFTPYLQLILEGNASVPSSLVHETSAVHRETQSQLETVTQRKLTPQEKFLSMKTVKREPLKSPTITVATFEWTMDIPLSQLHEVAARANREMREAIRELRKS